MLKRYMTRPQKDSIEVYDREAKAVVSVIKDQDTSFIICDLLNRMQPKHLPVNLHVLTEACRIDGELIDWIDTFVFPGWRSYCKERWRHDQREANRV